MCNTFTTFFGIKYVWNYTLYFHKEGSNTTYQVVFKAQEGIFKEDHFLVSANEHTAKKAPYIQARMKIRYVIGIVQFHTYLYKYIASSFPCSFFGTVPVHTSLKQRRKKILFIR